MPQGTVQTPSPSVMKRLHEILFNVQRCKKTIMSTAVLARALYVAQQRQRIDPISVVEQLKLGACHGWGPTSSVGGKPVDYGPWMYSTFLQICQKER